MQTELRFRRPLNHLSPTALSSLPAHFVKNIHHELGPIFHGDVKAQSSPIKWNNGFMHLAEGEIVPQTHEADNLAESIRKSTLIRIIKSYQKRISMGKY